MTALLCIQRRGPSDGRGKQFSLASADFSIPQLHHRAEYTHTPTKLAMPNLQMKFI
jgi:hypothetical protein